MNDQKRNLFIELCKYFCSLLVIMIHTNMGCDINEWIWVLIQTISRFAVPFFLCISGYFYYKKLKKGSKKTVLISSIKKYLFYYCIATMPYFLIWIVKNTYNKSIIDNVVELPKMFLWSGISKHLWYFPALILSVIVASVLLTCIKDDWIGILFIISAILYLTCSFVDIYSRAIYKDSILANSFIYKEFIRPAFYSLSFFLCGIALNRKIGRSSKYWLGIMICALFVEQIITYAIGINDTFTFAVVNLFLLPEIVMIIITREVKVRKNFEFGKASTFIYFYHPIIIMLASKIFNNSMLQWLFTAAILTLICFLLTKTNNKIYMKNY